MLKLVTKSTSSRNNICIAKISICKFRQPKISIHSIHSMTFNQALCAKQNEMFRWFFFSRKVWHCVDPIRCRFVGQHIDVGRHTEVQWSWKMSPPQRVRRVRLFCAKLIWNSFLERIADEFHIFSLLQDSGWIFHSFSLSHELSMSSRMFSSLSSRWMEKHEK